MSVKRCFAAGISPKRCGSINERLPPLVAAIKKC